MTWQKKSETAIDEILERLEAYYIDLLLLHNPAGKYFLECKSIEKAAKEGKVKSIGLSSFEGDPLEEILEKCKIKPTIITVESNLNCS